MAKRKTYLDKGHYGLGWETFPEDFFECGIVEVAYGMYQNQRFNLEYHDWYHIVELAETAREVGVSLSREQALALLFHDCVYVPGASKGSNELASVLALRKVASKVKNVDVDLSCEIILNTTDHVPTRQESRLVLDLDLSPIGDPDPVIFYINDDCIWAENAHLFGTDEREARLLFRQKRAEFGMSFLERPQIYYTAEFLPREKQARHNLQRLVDAATLEYLPLEDV